MATLGQTAKDGNQMTDQISARKHTKNIRDFFYHLMVFVFINVLLVAIDLQAVTSGRPMLGLDFAFWVSFGWGLGVAGHAIAVFLSDDRPAARRL